MDLSDPALLIALVVGLLALVVYMKLLPPKPGPPRCLDCDLVMERGDVVADSEHPEHQFIPGERRAYFHCPQCQRKIQARY